MYTTKIYLFFCLVIFGAYAEYQAGKVVKRAKARERRLNEESCITQQDSVFMMRALELSHEGHEAGKGGPFGSVLVHNGKIIGESWSTRGSLTDRLAHAEFQVIRHVSKLTPLETLEGLTIYTSAFPCETCLSLIHSTGVDKVFYCLSAEEMTSFDHNLKPSYRLDRFSDYRHDKPTPAVPILRHQAADAIERYKRVAGE